MELTREEENMLRGEGGESLSTAYRILLAIGEATDAERLVPVQWAHISGANYNTIGDSGMNFLEGFSKNAHAKIRTTVNPVGFDRNKLGNIPDSFVSKQMSIMRSYNMLGAVPSFTCIPYEIFDIPNNGSPVSFGESSAAIFANSILGLFSNRESGLSSLASAITGKTPYSNLQIESFRHAKVAIKTDYDLTSELDYGLLGFFVGNTVEDNCVAFSEGREKISTVNAKALSAGMGTSGSCGMFTKVDGTQQEIISCGKDELFGIKEQLNTADAGDLIVLGSPQLGLNELKLFTKLIQGKKLKKRCIIFCARAIHDQAKQLGVTDQIERAGGEFMCDSCACLTPLITRADFDSVVTNSVKAAYYLNKSNKLGVSLKDLKNIVKEYADYN
jgi:phosphomecalonate degydratase large subunit